MAWWSIASWVKRSLSSSLWKISSSLLPLISGASILGDGTVVLILNMAALMPRLPKSPFHGSDGMSTKVRVLVVDDSALMRKLISQVLSRDPSIEVIGTAMDGLIGLRKIEELRPDVVTLDLEMPRMDGMEMLRQITRKQRVPVIVFSAHTEAGASVTLKALALGAFDFVAKPQEAASGSIEQIASELALKIKVAAASGAPKLIISEPARQAERARERLPLLRWPSRICRNRRFDRRSQRAWNMYSRSFRKIFPAACSWSSTCRRGLPECLHAA